MFERSFHFIPGNKPRLFDRIEFLGADAYVFDLEDAVARSEKQYALGALDDWLGSQRRRGGLYVRVNGFGDSLGEQECILLEKYPELGVVLPKVVSADYLSRSSEYYKLTSSRSVIGLIEDAAGLLSLPEILDLKLLCAVGLGLEDFLCHSVYNSEDVKKLTQRIRTEIALNAMAQGIGAIDTISLDLSGGTKLKCEVLDARACGLTAKFSIHPSQITVINDGFYPSRVNVSKAHEIQKHFNSEDLDSGYIRMGNELISPPKLKKLNLIRKYSKHHEFTKK